MPAKRLLLRAVIAIAMVIVIVSATVRMQQYAFRRRAERLHREVQVLEVGKATLADVQSWLGSVSSAYGQSPYCSSENCVVDLRVGDFADAHWAFFARHSRLLHVYGLFGGRLARAVASANIHRGVVRSKDYSLMIQVLPDKNNRPVDGDLFGHTLIADSTVSQELPPALMTRSRHESYWIGWPGGCEICIAIDVRFQAGASPDDIRRVGRFDFSWLTPGLPLQACNPV